MNLAALIAIVTGVILAIGILGSLICFVLVLIQMFRRDQQTLGFVCIVTSLVAGFGTIVAFVFGWLKVSEWQIKKTMIVWTICQLLQMLGIALLIFMMFAYARAYIEEGIDKANQSPRRRVEVFAILRTSIVLFHPTTISPCSPLTN